MMQEFMGYTALESGMAMMPRGLGSFAAMFVVGRLIGRVDTRLILMTGLALSAFSLWQMTHFDLSMTAGPIIVAGIIQGVGVGLIFVPLSTLAFTTLPPHLRSEATGVYTLVRSLGSSAGISIMQALWSANAAVSHADLAAHVSPDNWNLAGVIASGVRGLENLNAEITRQAAMVAYVDDFKVMLLITFACMPLLILMRTPKLDLEARHAVVE
jgi:DHA2 family multidrug resistance protein